MGDMNVSVLTVLQNMINGAIGIINDFISLPEKSKKKRSYNRVKKASRPSAGESIENRPKEINARETVGHWEMDVSKARKRRRKPFWF